MIDSFFGGIGIGVTIIFLGYLLSELVFYVEDNMKKNPYSKVQVLFDKFMEESRQLREEMIKNNEEWDREVNEIGTLLKNHINNEKNRKKSN